MTSHRLRIGVDTHAIGERKTGNERVFANLVPELIARSKHDFVLFFTDGASAKAWPAGDRTKIRLIRPSNRLVRYPLLLPALARREQLDVLLVQYTASKRIPCPVVPYVHDVSFAAQPRFFGLLERMWLQKEVPSTMKRAASVITVSEFSRREISRIYPFTAGKIVVAPDAPDPIFAGKESRVSPQEPPYFLAVGDLRPRKNMAVVIRGFRMLVNLHPEIRERLLLVGQNGPDGRRLHRDAADLEAAGRLAFLGYVSDEQLVGLQQHATALVYPSLYEGFGLPVVEAMATGTPALVSDIPVMSEVAGEAAVRLPPTEPRAWTEALRMVAIDPAHRAALVEAGLKRAASFSWARSADLVLQALEKASS